MTYVLEKELNSRSLTLAVHFEPLFCFRFFVLRNFPIALCGRVTLRHYQKTNCCITLRCQITDKFGTFLHWLKQIFTDHFSTNISIFYESADGIVQRIQTWVSMVDRIWNSDVLCRQGRDSKDAEEILTTVFEGLKVFKTYSLLLPPKFITIF